MKSQNRYMTLLATASMLLAGAAYAQSSSGAGAGSSGSSSGTTSGSSSGTTSTGSSTTNRSGTTSGSSSATQPGGSTTGSSMPGAGSTYGSDRDTMGASSSMSALGAGAMARVSKDAADNRFTAKDLIGSAVYDAAGERIGDIADIDLRGAVPGSLMMSYTQGKSDKTSATGSGQMGSSTATRAGSSTSGQSGSLAQTGSSTTAGSTGATSTTGQAGMGSSSANRSVAGGSVSGGSATDALRDSSRALASGIDSAFSGASVLISVGGLWGIGDDLVSAPLSMLSYNTSKEHFELSASKAEVVALTESPDRDSGFAATGTGMGSASSTAAGKQAFGDEVSRVQSALRTDPETAGFAHNVMVTSDGDTLELRGTVESNEHKKKIVDAAREATTLKIDDDELNVRE